MKPLAPDDHGMRRRAVNALLLAAALPPVAATRAFAEEPEWAHDAGAPTPEIRVMDFDWVDAQRARPVPVRLYWPSRQAAGARVPLVVFSHGIGGSRQGYSYLGRAWSSRGVASLHVQHVGSDSHLWRGNPFGVVGRLQAAAQEPEAIARSRDVRFALDQMLHAAMQDRGLIVDPQRLLMAGHSYGANTTLLALGARVMREGRVVECPEPRFCAGLVISAPPFYGEPDLTAVLGRIQVPTLHVTATQDVIEIPGYRSGAADRLEVFRAVGDPRKLLAVFEGGSHSIFTDRAVTGGLALNPKVKAATAELGLAFADLVFQQDSAGLARWRDAWQPLLALAPGTRFPASRSAAS